MNTKRCLSILLSLLITLPMFGQELKKKSRGAIFTKDDVTAEVVFYSPSIVRVIKYPQGVRPDKVSFSVTMKPGKVSLKYDKNETGFTISSDKLSVVIDRESGSLAFFSKEGDTRLIGEAQTPTMFTPIKDIGEETYMVAQTYTLDKDEDIYGLGQQQDGAMSRRGREYYLFNSNMNICIPYIYSSKGYGLYWDNYSPTRFADNESGMSFSSEVGDCMDYYVLYGGDAEGTVAEIRKLTGEAPMFPLWTFGFWQCRERYESQEQILGVLHKYRELQVPLDGIVQDWRYWGANLTDPMWNSMRFDNPLFPDPKAMVDDVHANNAHIMISVWPSFGPATNQYKELDAIHALLNFSTWPTGIGVKPYDPFHPKAADIYWKYLSEMHKLGLDAWWLDGTEPDHFDRTDKDMENKMYYGSYKRLKNAYPIACIRNVYNNLTKVDRERRAFLMTRSATFGQQRYASAIWSGDVYSDWGVFRNQIAAGQNFVLCGMPYWNTDIGGFFAWSYQAPEKNKAFHELHTRWLQFGTFCPLMRSHKSSPTKPEIFELGKRGDWVYDVEEKFIKLRYKLLPYTYSSAWQITSASGNLLRPLLMDFASDKKAQKLANEYMYGKSILVCAVTDPLYTMRDTLGYGYEGDFSVVKNYPVYLPDGTRWFGFFDEKVYEGGAWMKYPAPIDEMPVFVKAGSIIPFGPDVQYAVEKPWDVLTVKVYPGADATFTLYEDEFDNYNYEKNRYSLIEFKWNDKERCFTIAKRKGSYSNMLTDRSFNIQVVGSDKVTHVDYSGNEVQVKL